METNQLKTKNRIFCLGDIHGEIGHLNTVLALITCEANFDLEAGDELVQLGDKPDRGEHSYEVIELFKSLQEKYPQNVHCLFGNHELMMLQAASLDPRWTETYYYPGNGGKNTLESYSRKTNFYGKKSLINSLAVTGHHEFIRKHLLFLETENYFFCHAPIPRVGFCGRQRDKDFRLDQHLLTWAFVQGDESVWVDPDPCDGKLAIYGHVHGLQASKKIYLPNGYSKYEPPGVRRYGQAILLDTGSGCADYGYLSCLELPAMRVYTSRGDVFDLPK